MSSLDNLKDDWESLAERDALHAILTDSTKRGGQWEVAEFMATGSREIETLMQHLYGLGYAPDREGVALDFGCGVGRLTQALGRCFASCVGVDISQGMIDRAQMLNELPQCQYVRTSEIPLPFPTATFSFIYSNIVLQHIPRRFAKEYLREFIRVLAPGGMLVFGVQDSFAVTGPSALLTRFRHILQLRSRINAVLKVGGRDMKMHCLPEHLVRYALGSARIVDVQFTNAAAKDFNGRLVYLPQAPSSGYVSKQYCVTR